MKTATSVVLMTIIALAGCKKEEAAPTATTEAPTPPKAAPAKPAATAEEPAAAANPMAAAAKAMNDLAKAQGGKPLGKLVNWRKLAPILPDKIGAFASDGELKGSTAGLKGGRAMGMQVSTVKRKYKAGEKKLRVEIVDTAAAAMIRTGFAMAAHIVEDSSDGIKKGVKVDGQTGFLEWRKARSRGKLTVLVGDRFMLSARLRPTSDPEEVVKLVKQLDLKKLAGLKAE